MPIHGEPVASVLHVVAGDLAELTLWQSVDARCLIRTSIIFLFEVVDVCHIFRLVYVSALHVVGIRHVSHVTGLHVRQHQLFLNLLVGGDSGFRSFVRFPGFVLSVLNFQLVLDGVRLIFDLDRVLRIFAIESFSQNGLFHCIFPSDLLFVLAAFDEVQDERV